ncbi:MAG TPA: DoxX family protein [Ktedonobacteraceae bacterium]
MQTRLAQLAPLVLRIVVGIVFIVHGYMKITNLAQTTGFFIRASVPLPNVVAPVVALLEIIGGLALLLGLYSRTFSLLLIIDMLFAISLAKNKTGFVGGWEFELTLIAILLAIVLAGPGVISLTRQRSRATREPSVAT